MADTTRHPSVEAIITYFSYQHLTGSMWGVAYACAELKDKMLSNLEDSPELTMGLRKLLEAKDCFVRAALSQENNLDNPSVGK